MNTHTPGPWYQGQIKGTEHQIFTNEVGVFIDDDEASHADIAFIVRACNSYAAMLEALKQIAALYDSAASSDGEIFLDESEIGQIAKAALAKAQAEGGI